MTEQWFDATLMGSAYEQRTSYSGQWQHRPLRRPRDLDPPDPFGRNEGMGEWRLGPAPDYKPSTLSKGE